MPTHQRLLDEIGGASPLNLPTLRTRLGIPEEKAAPFLSYLFTLERRGFLVIRYIGGETLVSRASSDPGEAPRRAAREGILLHDELPI